MNINNKVRICEKQLLSVQETAEYFGIGTKRIYRIIKSNPYADYLITVGNRTKIKRKAFEEFINKSSII